MHAFERRPYLTLIELHFGSRTRPRECKWRVGITLLGVPEFGLHVTDVVMPEMNGQELANYLLSLCPDLRSLFISGYTANAIAHHGVLAEGVHLIQKPFSLRNISANIREALGN